MLLSLCFVPLMNAKADYFTYVPDLSIKLLHVYNSTLNTLVASVTMFGSPRNVYVSHSGIKVFVSSVLTEGSTSKSYVNVVNAVTNKVESGGIIGISGNNVRGLVTTQDDSVLFVTHEDGITKIDRPGAVNTSTDLDLTYSGLGIEISDDDKYLFVIGSDGINTDGISVVDIESFTEVATFLLGSSKGANEIVFDNDGTNPQLFVALSQSDQVVAIKINSYNDPNALSLDLFKVRDFKIGANPIDLQLNKDNSELLVVLSYIKDQQGIDNGNIVLLETQDITNTVSSFPEIFFGFEKSSFPSDLRNIIHPLAVNIDDNDFIYVLKQIWSDTTGIYVTKLSDSTNISTGKRTIEEVQSYNLGNKVSTLANGKFLGPNCDVCPTGATVFDENVERPAAINLFLLVLLSGLVFGFRRGFRRSFRRYK